MAGGRVALVLGAGGITGGAYELGTLAAIHERTGWEPASAYAFIGTSAGSWIAALLAFGRPLQQVTSAARPPEPGPARRRDTGASTRDLYTPAPRLPSPFWWARPGGLLAESGLFSTEGMERRLRARLGEAAQRWPAANLRIVAFDLQRRARTVFGAAGSPRVTALQAVTASSAIPGVFRPVVIDGVPYLDGGIASTTNLDLAAEFAAAIDLVICLAPMAGERPNGAPQPGPGLYGQMLTGALAAVAGHQLDAEAHQLRAAFPRLEIATFRPNADDRRAMGANAMSGRRREPARQQAYGSALAALEQPELRAQLARGGIG
ncbi:MAG TPA: patatin-like phospholipase family protein [Dehalococcoidia bacterium]|nr:patatin-like phospholipase family protein [Dehalococcoidia bacterium]